MSTNSTTDTMALGNDYQVSLSPEIFDSVPDNPAGEIMGTQDDEDGKGYTNSFSCYPQHCT